MIRAGAAAIAFAALLVACDAGTSTRSSATPMPGARSEAIASYRGQFLKVCERGGVPERAAYCQCVEGTLEAHYDIGTLDALMTNPRLKRAFAAVTRACAASSGLRLRHGTDR